MTAASPGELAGAEREGSGKQHEGATVKRARNTESLASRRLQAAMGMGEHARLTKRAARGGGWWILPRAWRCWGRRGAQPIADAHARPERQPSAGPFSACLLPPGVRLQTRPLPDPSPRANPPIATAISLVAAGECGCLARRPIYHWREGSAGPRPAAGCVSK